jgi:predicted DNA-binding transcriptional regulator YafY
MSRLTSFAPDIARYVKEEELFVRPRMKDLSDGSMIFEVTVNNEKEFIRWILQYGASAEILEPRAPMGAGVVESATIRLDEHI